MAGPVKNNIPSHSRNIHKVFLTIETVKPHGGTIGQQYIRDVTLGLVHNQILNKMSSMKLPLLAVVIVLTTRAFACNYDRINRDPNYAEISKPKSTLKVPGPHGICVAPNGDIAVVSYFKGNKVHIYYSCGKMMKAVDLTKYGYQSGTDCTFMNNFLYVIDYNGKNVFKLSMTGEFVKVFHRSERFIRVTSCKNELFFTKNAGGKNVVVFDGNGKRLRSFSVPGSARGIIVGIDGYLYVSNVAKQVYKYTKQGKQVGVTNYNVQHDDGLAMDSAGHLLIADYLGRKVVVYSPCGGLIKTIQVHSKAVPDVEIGNDGTVIVADYGGNKVLLY